MRAGFKLIHGVGINDAGYATSLYSTEGYCDGKQIQKLIWRCPFYVVWKDMLRRCHSEKYKASRPTYKDCTVCEEWLTFSNFKAWMETQDWEGNQLDKDLLLSGNKKYGPEFCLFVSGRVNSFLIERTSCRGDYPLGVYLHNQNGNFVAQCSNPFKGKKEHLGVFASSEDAHQAWLTRKLELAHSLADTQKDQRVAKLLIERYSNYGV